MELISKLSAYVQHKDFLIPLVLSSLFLICFFSFSIVFFCVLITALLVLINYYKVGSRLTENLLFLCFPIIGLIANYHSLCLVFNATVFFMWTRSYAVHGTIKWRYVGLFFLMIASFATYQDSPTIVYWGAIAHGIFGPLNIWFYTRKNKFVNKLVFLVPLQMLTENAINGHYFISYWDVEIIAYYVLWFLGYDKEQVVTKMFTLSLTITCYAHMLWDVCANT